MATINLKRATLTMSEKSVINHRIRIPLISLRANFENVATMRGLYRETHTRGKSDLNPVHPPDIIRKFRIWRSCEERKIGE